MEISVYFCNILNLAGIKVVVFNTNNFFKNVNLAFNAVKIVNICHSAVP